jgi:hypothetical protein
MDLQTEPGILGLAYWTADIQYASHFLALRFTHLLSMLLIVES